MGSGFKLDDRGSTAGSGIPTMGAKGCFRRDTATALKFATHVWNFTATPQYASVTCKQNSLAVNGTRRSPTKNPALIVVVEWLALPLRIWEIPRF